MKPTHIPVGKYYWGIGACLLTLLTGLWLILAPFALRYQSGNTGAWAATTMNDFWVGIGVAIVAGAGLVLFVLALVGTLQSAGVLPVRRRRVPATSTPGSTSPEITPYANLEQAMATLAAALEADLTERHQADSQHKVESIKIGG
jgi:hypothetical protein